MFHDERLYAVRSDSSGREAQINDMTAASPPSKVFSGTEANHLLRTYNHYIPLREAWGDSGSKLYLCCVRSLYHWDASRGRGDASRGLRVAQEHKISRRRLLCRRRAHLEWVSLRAGLTFDLTTTSRAGIAVVAASQVSFLDLVCWWVANKLVTIYLDQSMIVSLTSFKSKEVTISTAIILLRALVVHTCRNNAVLMSFVSFLTNK